MKKFNAELKKVKAIMAPHHKKMQKINNTRICLINNLNRNTVKIAKLNKERNNIRKRVMKFIYQGSPLVFLNKATRKARPILRSLAESHLKSADLNLKIAKLWDLKSSSCVLLR